jgi:Tol biopolymer transport system component
MRHRLAIALAAASVIAGGLTVSQSADAAYPGGDGKIAFVRANQIYVINADGTGLKQLTTGAKNYRPKWSPNGQRIAYIHEATGGSKDIWVMSATGTNRIR